MSSPLSVLCKNMVWKDIFYFDIPQKITLVHYLDDIVPTAYGEQDTASALDAIRHMHGRRTSRKLRVLPHQ